MHDGKDDRPEALLRRDLITYDYVRKLQKQLEAEYVRFSSNDGQSTRDWADKLRADDSLLGEFKGVTDEAPAGSCLAADTLFLAVQTPYQRERFKNLCHRGLVCIDATHNTTMYQGVLLTTLIGRDKWGHGTR